MQHNFNSRGRIEYRRTIIVSFPIHGHGWNVGLFASCWLVCAQWKLFLLLLLGSELSKALWAVYFYCWSYSITIGLWIFVIRLFVVDRPLYIQPPHPVYLSFGQVKLSLDGHKMWQMLSMHSPLLPSSEVLNAFGPFWMLCSSFLTRGLVVD